MSAKRAELLDLRTIPLVDLKRLIEICAAQKTNRFFEDNFVILSRVLFSKHEYCEMSDYSHDELQEAEAVFLDLLERNQHLSNEHPTRMFLRFNFTASYDERRKRQNLKAVK